MEPDLRPDLDPGLAWLERPASRSTALHHLVVDTIEATGGPTLWVDARSHASTYALFDVAPDRRLLAGLRVARAFTAYQHHTLVRELARRADRETQLVVAPAVDSLYRDDDLDDREAADLLAASLATLSGVADALEVPVLVTADAAEPGDVTDVADPAEAADSAAGASAAGTGATAAGRGGFAALLAAHADRTIACRRTDQGYYYETEGFATRCYVGRGYWQTTIPYWVELCGVADGPGHPALADALARVGLGAGGGLGDGPAQPTLAGAVGNGGSAPAVSPSASIGEGR